MAWDIEFTDEFGAWWEALNLAEQESVGAVVTLLQLAGPSLEFPRSSQVHGSRYGGMRELRIQHCGEPYRVLYIFDPRRVGALLLGGCKGGDDRWYETNVPRADKVYDAWLEELRKEGLV